MPFPVFKAHTGTDCPSCDCRPLAGTRRRGKDLEEDLALEAELLADEKECSEHVMLVDLGRNDVGKVAQMGSVSVDRLMEVERYSHVMHISSTVTGKLLPELNAWDVMRAALPAGTVSGAPKVDSHHFHQFHTKCTGPDDLIVLPSGTCDQPSLAGKSM